ncbi:hypothetical protein PVAP13_2NG539803 [Panicum virgatum]|uniref:Uncharacterized protein n=1 Tax=Panicum virgatum TaxID=38727 RepID=A0A8T0VQP3_PANVG|nr:hypothetical protein PVAP13_2NG539803 [Panicum virgatum]
MDLTARAVFRSAAPPQGSPGRSTGLGRGARKWRLHLRRRLSRISGGLPKPAGWPPPCSGTSAHGRFARAHGDDLDRTCSIRRPGWHLVYRPPLAFAASAACCASPERCPHDGDRRAGRRRHRRPRGGGEEAAGCRYAVAPIGVARIGDSAAAASRREVKPPYVVPCHPMPGLPVYMVYWRPAWRRSALSC